MPKRAAPQPPAPQPARSEAVVTPTLSWYAPTVRLPPVPESADVDATLVNLSVVELKLFASIEYLPSSSRVNTSYSKFNTGAVKLPPRAAAAEKVTKSPALAPLAASLTRIVKQVTAAPLLCVAAVVLVATSETSLDAPLVQPVNVLSVIPV